MLANDSYASLATLDDHAACLNLAWTLDEPAFCAPLDHVVAAVLANGADHIAHYAVQDPWGEHMLGPAMHRHLGLAQAACTLTCSAGVGTLLHALAHVAIGSAAWVCGDVYPDFPHWAGRVGATCLGAATASAAAHARAVMAAGAAVVLVERPAMRGTELDLATMRVLCTALAGTGVVIVVDESNANYCTPAFSAATLVPAYSNLVVLRGLSKGFHMGGLRVGIAIAQPALAATVRSALPPMQATPLSLALARAVLEQGDSCAALRTRIAHVRTAVARRLAASSCPASFVSHPHAPYLFAADPDGAAADWLAGRGIIGKRQPFWTAAGPVHALRLSLPLTDARLRIFAERIAP